MRKQDEFDVRIRQALDARFSGVTGQFGDAERVLRLAKGEEKTVKKKLSAAFILVIILMLAAVGALAAVIATAGIVTWNGQFTSVPVSELASPSPVPSGNVLPNDSIIDELLADMPTRVGHTFAGYWDAQSAGTQYYNADGTSAHIWEKNAVATLYARWTANTYAITYTGMDGAVHGTNHPGTHTYGTATAISNPTKSGCAFVGWKVNGGTETKNLTLAADGYTADITLEAVWTTAFTVTVTGGSGSGNYAPGETVTITADAPARAKRFSKWSIRRSKRV